MPTTITPVPPFYDEHSSAPPPCAPTLTDQQELLGKVVCPPSGLLADEVITSRPRTSRPSPSCVAPEFKIVKIPTKSPTVRLLSPAPYTKPKQTSVDSSEGSSVESSSDDDSTSTSSSEGSKIPKPAGEPGRPGRGGYKLETALGWNQKLYSRLKKHTDSLIDEHLDVTKCASAQNVALLKIVQSKATDKFPDLENYAQCWPVTDLIMMRLKYTSSRARKQELEMAAGKSKKSKSV